MKTRTKILLGIALAVLLGIAGGAYWLYSSLDSLVASAIRQYGPEITGVSVKLSSANIKPADGTAALRGLLVGNPEGFKTEHALSLGEISMRLDTGKKSNGATAAEAVKQVLGAIIQSVAKATRSLGVVDSVKKDAEAVGGKIKGLFK